MAVGFRPHAPGLLLPVLLLAAGLSASRSAPSAPSTQGRGAQTGWDRLPLAFEENHGQTDPRVRFLAHTHGGAVLLTGTETLLCLPPGRALRGRTAPPSRAPVL